MQAVMAQTKLPRDVCAQVWELSNPEGEEVFTKQMFLVAMHLMYKKRKDPSTELPDSVPHELAVSAGLAPPQQQQQREETKQPTVDFSPQQSP